MTIYYSRRPFSVFAIFMLLSGLWSCSGGTLSSDTNQPDPPVLVNAGANQSVNEGVTVVLTGTASGNSALTYSWSVSPVLTITQSSNTDSTATFVAPTTTEILTYVFTLVVTDADGNQGTDTVEYTINPVNEAPNALVSVLTPTNILDNRYPAGVEVVLDGSASNDADSADTLSPIAAWRWQQTAGVEVLNDVSLDGDSIAFVTPILDAQNDISFSLTVTDSEGAEDTANLTLSVLSASQTKPIVNAGKDHQVFSGEIILLTGDAQTSIPAGEPLSFSWLNDSELSPVINNRSGERTYAVAPAVTSEQLVTFTLTVTDAFGNKVDDNLSVRVKPLPILPINDTGVTLQATQSAITNQHQPDFPGQDGQRGKDIISENGLLEKAGRGEQGFDFTRLDEIGDEQDDTSQPWSCVRDNITGLVWEVKTTDNGLHDTQHSYAWLQDENNGGLAGSIGNAGLTCTLSQCNTSAFIAAVNAAGLCNFYDWRLPTHDELLSVMHFGNATGTKIDLGYFPNTQGSNSAPLWYWSSQPSADGVADDTAQNSWALDFTTGNDNFLNKSTQAKVRLVRGGR